MSYNVTTAKKKKKKKKKNNYSVKSSNAIETFLSLRALFKVHQVLLVEDEEYVMMKSRWKTVKSKIKLKMIKI